MIVGRLPHHLSCPREEGRNVHILSRERHILHENTLASVYLHRAFRSLCSKLAAIEAPILLRHLMHTASLWHSQHLHKFALRSFEYCTFLFFRLLC